MITITRCHIPPFENVFYTHIYNTLTLILTQNVTMNNEQFQTFLTALDSLTKQLGEQGQEIAQFTAAIKESSSKEKGAEDSIHNPANKLKISVKLPMYSGELNENIFLWCKQ